MRIVVTGATGNVGTSVVRALAGDPQVDEIVGLARRPSTWRPPGTRWISADIARDDLVEYFRGADAVIHLAWLIQPGRDEAELERVNVAGSRRVFEAAAEAGVGALVHASSIGVYSPGPAAPAVDESYPREGIATSFYSRHKVAAEDALDAVEAASDLRVVRLRPALIFKREAAAEIRRLFAGPLLPNRLLNPSWIPILPFPDGLVFQCVHAHDVGEAYRLAATSPDARGAYNIAADPVLDADALGRILDARPLGVSPRVLRTLARASWRARLQPSEPGWLDMGMAVPVMSTRRAREELGWQPLHSATDTLLELLAGLRASAGGPTPPLDRHAGGRFRIQEVLTGVGARHS